MSSPEQRDGAAAPGVRSGDVSGTNAAANVASSGSQRVLATPVKSSPSLAEFQEHLSLLREGLVATENNLDSVPPGGVPGSSRRHFSR
ncbi:hypothetical protein MRX96_008388 [Rhipicephalus microplus]